MTSDYIVVTNCTSRKRAGIPLVRMETPGHADSLKGAVQRWRELLALQPAVVSVRQLYVGRSINEAKVVSDELDAELHVVSAGLGLVAADLTVPGYDLSAAEVDKGLHSVLERYSASVTDWWRELTGEHGLRSLLSRSATLVVLLALPTNYLRLIFEELQSLPPKDASRLRVFTSTAGGRLLAQLPTVPVMPYDERLESLPAFAGTRSDFPQRALRHFVCQLGAHKLAVDAARQEVEIAMSSCVSRAVPSRRRISDAEVCDFIRKGWHGCGGNSARLLRYLRDDELVACEQGRFAELRRRVGREFSGQSISAAQEHFDVS